MKKILFVLIVSLCGCHTAIYVPLEAADCATQCDRTFNGQNTFTKKMRRKCYRECPGSYRGAAIENDPSTDIIKETPF